METLNDFVTAGSILFLDTAPVIYFVERKEPYFTLLEAVFTRIDLGELTVITSAITLAECLYYPYKNEDHHLVEAFTRQLTNGHNVHFIPTTIDIADRSAQLRARYNLGFADAFQVATAFAAGCDAFLTNDKQLKRVESLDILVLNDFLI